MSEAIPIEDALSSLGSSDPDLAADIASWDPVVGLVKAIVQLRKRGNLTQAELAERVGRKQSAIARLESAEQDPRWSTVHETLLALGHRIQFVPTEGDLILLTDTQLDEIIQRHIAEVFEELQQRAVSDALVRIAGTRTDERASAKGRAHDLVVNY